MAGLNANPTLFAAEHSRREASAASSDPAARDPIDSLEIFDLVRDIKDPEHPHTLEQLRVAQASLITVDDVRGRVSDLQPPGLD